MNWIDVTRQLSKEFNLQGSFLYRKSDKLWVGSQPIDSFRNYLEGLFVSKESSYFNELRFFKYSEPEQRGDTKVTRYLGLVPIEVNDVDFDFLGIIYEDPDNLQELLKFRILPMYLAFWLHRIVAESRVRHSDESHQQALVEALEEKRLYAQQLETRVKDLSAEIEAIKNSEMGLDQKVSELGRLLEEHHNEYQGLAVAYQEIFNQMQALQNEYLSTSVDLEHKILDLEVERRRLRVKLRKQERDAGKSGGGYSEAEYLDLGRRLKTAQEQAAQYNSQYHELKKELGDVEPDQVRHSVKIIKNLQDTVKYWRKRSSLQEQELQKLHRHRQNKETAPK